MWRESAEVHRLVNMEGNVCNAEVLLSEKNWNVPQIDEKKLYQK